MEIIVALFRILLGSLLGAILLRAAIKWVVNEDVKFGKAFKTSLITHLILNFLLFGVVFVLAVIIANRLTELMLILYIIGGFLIQSLVISSRHKLTFSKACLVSVVAVGLFLAIIIGITIIIFTIKKLYLLS